MYFTFQNLSRGPLPTRYHRRKYSWYNDWMVKLNAKQLRSGEFDPLIAKTIKKNPVTIILDNVLDTYNVGSIFRLADAVAAEKVILCGQTLTPPNSRIKKASVNTWEWVDWEYADTAAGAVSVLRVENESLKVIAVEQDPRSKPFNTVHYQFPIAIIVGNESYGVSKEALNMADIIVEMPMWGINTSLNVMVSSGIILYEIMKKVDTK